ncbi:MAG: OmpA family protein [Treponema sp.]|nr:OmpA family protein [Treponema sp.]
MRNGTLLGLPVAIVLALGLLISSCTGTPPPPVDNRPHYVDEPQAVIVHDIEELIEEWEDENIDFILDSAGNMRLVVTIVFRANNADFVGLNPDVIASNNLALDHVAEILHRFNHYNVTIEGNANPTSPLGPQRDSEEPALQRISEQRAQRVLDELAQRGVSTDRKTVTGVGTARPLYPHDDHENNWKNRRVEFILTRR